MGDDLLVTPIVESEAQTLRIFLPPGQWKNMENKEIHNGPGELDISSITIDSNIFFTRVK